MLQQTLFLLVVLPYWYAMVLSRYCVVSQAEHRGGQGGGDGNPAPDQQFNLATVAKISFFSVVSEPRSRFITDEVQQASTESNDPKIPAGLQAPSS